LACDSDAFCVNGFCEDPCPGSTLCFGICTDTTSDPRNCGDCGAVCRGNQVCNGGICTTGGCTPNRINCGGMCVNPANDPANCGGCGITCPGRPLGSTCIDAECRCPGRQAACGGICTDLQTDTANCGACGVVCAQNQICADGLCRLDCPDDFTVCGDECRNLRTDPDNCGACGAACARLEVCNNGRCDTSCGNLTSCNGICRDLEHDPGHCGSCGNACGMGEVCVDGECSLVCGPGITNCDGVCRDLRVDPQNCGACGNRCASRQVCTNGACTTISTDPSYSLGPSPLMFINACNQPGATVFLQNIDDAFGTFMLPFTFRFYGTPMRTTWVSSNGVIGFGSPSPEFSNTCGLMSGVSNGVLAFWDDLYTRASGVCVATVGPAPNRQFIATWSDVALLSDFPRSHLTFSVVLNEGTDTIDVLYATAFDTLETQGSSASIGIASSTAFSLECCNAACVTNNTGKRYTPR
jgi:hypothetical protein